MGSAIYARLYKTRFQFDWSATQFDPPARKLLTAVDDDDDDLGKSTARLCTNLTQVGLYQAKKVWQCRRAASMESKWPGKSGRYFRVLNWDSLNGLSSDTCGRLCDWVTPRSASRNATGLEVIEEPRSAWMVS